MENTKKIPKGQLKGIVKTINGTSPDTNGEATVNKDALGLDNVDNTSDLSKPISTLTQNALDGKENTVVSGVASQYYRGDKSWQTLNKTAVGLTNVDNTTDLNKPISTATQTALNGKENVVTAGTTAQYYRGDKTFQTLNKAAVGLSNVDNTSDTSKPVSTATQTALDAKQATLVSGTNIKTINGESILGAGNITVSGGGSGSGDTFGVHILTKPQAGNFYSNEIGISGTGTFSCSTNAFRLFPFYPKNAMTVSNIYVNVSTAGSGSGFIGIYSDLNGVPNTLLAETSSFQLTTGTRTITLPFTFTGGTIYWIGVLTTTSAVLTATNLLPIINIGVADPITSFVPRYSGYARNSVTSLPTTITMANYSLDGTGVAKIVFKAV